MIFPAFAALDSQSDRRQLQHYRAWIKKLSSKEYADELMVLATAQTLQVCIVCVPYTGKRDFTVGHLDVCTSDRTATPTNLVGQ